MLPSPPRKPQSAFTPLSPFTPLSFRDVHEHTTKPPQPYSTPQPPPRPVTSTAFFRPIPQSSPALPAVSTLSFAASLPITPYRAFQFSSPLRPSQSTKREPPPPPSSYSTEKARFLRSLPHAHRYEAIVSTLEAEEQAEEQAATEWSDSLAAPSTPPLSPHDRRGGADVPTTPPSVCSLSSSSASSVGSFASPISAALSAIMERDSAKHSRGVLEDDDILTPSPDVVLGADAATATGVPSLPASIFSSVFSQRLPLPPLTAEAKQLLAQSPLRPPPAVAKTASSRPPLRPSASFPALQPTAFTFAAPLFTSSTPAVSGEWKGVMHIDEDRLYNATPTQSSASSSPVSSSLYISPSAFLSQASAASATSTVPSSHPDNDTSLPLLERVSVREGEDHEELPVPLSEVEAKLAVSSESSSETSPHPSSLESVTRPLQEPEGQNVPAQSPKTRRSLRSPAKGGAANAAQEPATASERHAEKDAITGMKRRPRRTRRVANSLSPSTASGPVNGKAQDAVTAAAQKEIAVQDGTRPKRRMSARVGSVTLSQTGETVKSARPAAVATEATRKLRGRLSKSLTPPFNNTAASTPAPTSPSLSSTQPGISLSQRTHRTSRSATSATWPCTWCTWESPLPHMSCDLCSKARGSRPDAVVEVEMKVAGRGRKRWKRMENDAAVASQSDEAKNERESQGSQRSASSGAGGVSDGQLSGAGTPVSQQLLPTPASSSPSSQSADTSTTFLSQLIASPPPTHSPALSPATLLAETSGEEETETEAAVQQRWTSTQPTALSASWTSSRRRRRVQLEADGSETGGISASQAAEPHDDQLASPTLHRRRRRRRW